MANKRPRIDVVFGPFTFSHPHLNAPDDKFGEDVYKVTGVEDPNSDAMKKAKAILADALKKFGLEKDAKLPLVRETIKDPNAPEGTRKPKRVETGKLALKAKSQYAPTILDAKCKEVDPAKVQIGGGTIGFIQGFLSPYESSNPSIGDGISFTLTHVQIKELRQGGGKGGPALFSVLDDAEGLDSAMGDDLGDDLAIGSDSDDNSDAGDGGVLDI